MRNNIEKIGLGELTSTFPLYNLREKFLNRSGLVLNAKGRGNEVECDCGNYYDPDVEDCPKCFP